MARRNLFYHFPSVNFSLAAYDIVITNGVSDYSAILIADKFTFAGFALLNHDHEEDEGKNPLERKKIDRPVKSARK